MSYFNSGYQNKDGKKISRKLRNIFQSAQKSMGKEAESDSVGANDFFNTNSVADVGISNADSLINMQQSLGNRYVQQIAESVNTESTGDDIASQIKSQIGKGNTLNRGNPAVPGSSFKDALDEVKIHTDSEADILTGDLGANAFTAGKDIFFKHGAYDPESSSGRRLLEHELTHVNNEVSGENETSQSPLQKELQSEISAEADIYLRSPGSRDLLLVHADNGHWEQTLRRTITVRCDMEAIYWSDVESVVEGWLNTSQTVLSDTINPASVTRAIMTRIREISGGPPSPGSANRYRIIARLSSGRMEVEVELVSAVRRRPPAARAEQAEATAEAPAPEAAEERAEAPEVEQEPMSEEERQQAIRAFAERHHVSEDSVMWTPIGPQIRLGTVAQEGTSWRDIPTDWSNQQIYTLVRESGIRDITINDEIRRTDWYRQLWDMNFALLSMREILTVIEPYFDPPVFGPIGAVVDNVCDAYGILTENRPQAARYLAECRQDTDRDATYWLVLERMGRSPAPPPR